MNRRTLITGLGLSLMAPAIVKADNLMKLPTFKPNEAWPYVWNRTDAGFELYGLGNGIITRALKHESKPLLLDSDIKKYLPKWQNYERIVALSEIRTSSRWANLATIGQFKP
jgi:hypothetical protein